MFVRKVTQSFTTDADGDATVFTEAIRGRILSIIFEDTDTAAGADFTITTEDTGQSILNATNSGGSDGQWQPRQQIHDTSAAGETYDGTNAINDFVYVPNERIKIVVDEGGNTKSGQFTILYG